MKLIRTGFREKLSQGISYPVGAELISVALADVPQFDGLRIMFNHSTWPHLYCDACNDRTKNFRVVFSVVFNQRPALSTFHNSWYVSVFAVPNERRLQVQDLLVKIGLPKVNNWLSSPRPETWYDKSMRVFTVAVLPDEMSICFVETRDHRLVSVAHHAPL